MSESQNQTQTLPKHGRKRFKELFTQIRAQMEFYFSDANLHKDRFMKQKINESSDGYVDLEMFLRFNKIRALVTDMSLLVKALKKSQLLELNEDATKVRRTLPLSQPVNVDERTVYVECLPAGVDREWLQKTFSGCGCVVYISLPKFKSTGDIKGFAFVEFETVEAAQVACQTMNNPPVSVVDKRPGWFPKSKDTKRIERQFQLQQAVHGGGRKRRASESMVDDVSSPPSQNSMRRQRTFSEGIETVTERSGTSHKRKRTIADRGSPGAKDQDSSEATSGKVQTWKWKERRRSSSDLELECKRTRTEMNEVESECEKDNGDRKVCHGEQNEQGEMAVESTDEVDKMESVSLTESTAVKQTESMPSTDEVQSLKPAFKPSAAAVKQLKKVKISADAPREEVYEGETEKQVHKNRKKKHTVTKDIPELRVISKCEWSKLRTEYLAMQKASMTQLKESLRHWKGSHPQPSVSSAKPESVATEVASAIPREATTLQFVENVIVHVTMEQPQQCLNRKQLRSDLATFGNIAYVDVIDGATEAFVRCVDAPAAAAIVNCHLPGCSLKLLTGDAERDYWTKAIADNLKKRSTKSKPAKQRGRDKVLKQAEKVEANQRKHIVFND